MIFSDSKVGRLIKNKVLNYSGMSDLQVDIISKLPTIVFEDSSIQNAVTDRVEILKEYFCSNNLSFLAGGLKSGWCTDIMSVIY